MGTGQKGEEEKYGKEGKGYSGHPWVKKQPSLESLFRIGRVGNRLVCVYVCTHMGVLCVLLGLVLVSDIRILVTNGSEEPAYKGPVQQEGGYTVSAGK